MSWEEYDRWNAAIADVVFSPAQGGLPVYLDLEDDLLKKVSEAAGHDGRDAEDALVAAVAGTVKHGAVQSDILRGHRQRVWKWEQGAQVQPPPVLAFLAATSLAAERMAQGEGMSSTNYYGRLAPMLGMKDRKDDLAQAYRRVAERWWSALNGWLENHDGRRGIPTAYSLGEQTQRYVGLPISQALIRTADRDGLVSFFQRVGFTPGTDVAPHALLPLLDAWIGQNPSPASGSLRRIWARPAARERVAEVAAVALSAWDGTVKGRGEGQRTDENLKIVATAGGFLKPRLELGLLAYLQLPEQPRDVRVLTATGGPTVSAAPTVVGALRLAGLEQADPGSLLEGVVTIEDSLTTRTTSRRPRRVVPLHQNDLLQQLVEADQIQAGEDLVLLAEESIRPLLEALLTEVARPGWRVATTLQGVPDRWVVVQDVQVLRSAAVMPADDLRCLVPLAQSSLTLAGGFALPGRLRRWHSWSPPEIRALDESGKDLCLRVTGLSSTQTFAGEAGSDDDQLVLEWDSDVPGALIVDLADEELSDGDYRVDLLRQGETKPVTSLVLRLRSGDAPDRIQWAQAPALGRLKSEPLSALGAIPVQGPGSWVRGASVDPGSVDPGDAAPPPTALPWWESTTQAPTTRGPDWQAGSADPTSCMYTGRHYLLLPDDRGGRPAERFIDSRCRDCGLVKRLPTTAWGARKRNAPVDTVVSAPLDVSMVSAVNRESMDRWGLAVDALGYLGGGDFQLLEKLALQVEGSALFVDHFTRTLECLGHIEVARDAESLAPVSWEITPSTLAQTADARWSLIGYWPSDLVEAVHQAVERRGGALVHEEPVNAPHCWFFEMPEGVGLPDLSGFEDLTVVPDASGAVSAELCSLTDLVDALPRRSADLVGDVTVFTTAGARWVPAGGVGAPGAYRVRRWSVTDYLRTPQDVADGTAARSTVHLSKHASVLGQRRPLVAYEKGTGALVVPLGADLPGLYGRAAVLASGLPPREDRVHRRLVYPGVPSSVAATIVHRLSS